MKSCTSSKAFFIAHFNDVYDIDEQKSEPIGGVARFLSLIRSLQNKFSQQLLTLFSGDVFSPSVLSNIYQGEQMIYPMNEFKIDIACLGNHDFDYPLNQVESLLKKTNFPWMLSNVYDNDTGKQLGDALQYFIKDIILTNGESLKIGLIGLAEEEWLGQITSLDQARIKYEDFIHCAHELSHQLREEQGCQYIIALTHMRIPNDRKLIQGLEAGTIDLVLGGHDHIWHWEKIKQTFYLKSGTNFRNLGLIRIDLAQDNSLTWINDVEDCLKQLTNQDQLYKPQNSDQYGILLPFSQYDLNKCKVTLLPINITKQIPADEKMRTYVDERVSQYNEETKKILGFTHVDLETRFFKIRNEESNLCNLYADLVQAQFGTDVAVFNTGTIRADEYFNVGPLTIQTFNKIFAIPDVLVSFKISGDNLHKLLENGVCKWPSYDGRFLGVSGIRFIFDPLQPENQRILKEDILINGGPIDYNREYTIATKSFITQGYDGFRQVPAEDFIIDSMSGIPVMQLILSFFETVRKSEIIRKVSQTSEEEIEDKHQQILQEVNCSVGHKDGYEATYKKFAHIVKDVVIHDYEPYIVVAPTVDGRITLKR